MKFSLILATINRTIELEQFLVSLDAQTLQDFELIIVDQNPDNRLIPILEKYKNSWPITHLHSEKGLSRARNIGIKHCTGDIVCWPDDDCSYNPDLLERIYSMMASDERIDGISGRAEDIITGIPLGRWDDKPGPLNKQNVWTRASSITIFLKRYVIDSVGEFDENLGLGAKTPWQSGEETDYLLRSIKNKFSILYNPNILIFHPVSQVSPEKAMKYAKGAGFVVRKHKYPIWFVLHMFLRPLRGIINNLVLGNFYRASCHQKVLLGRLKGWTHSK